MNCTETVTVWFTTEVIGPCRNRIGYRSASHAQNASRLISLGKLTTVDKLIPVEWEGESEPHFSSISWSLKPHLVLLIRQRQHYHKERRWGHAMKAQKTDENANVFSTKAQM